MIAGILKSCNLVNPIYFLITLTLKVGESDNQANQAHQGSDYHVRIFMDTEKLSLQSPDLVNRNFEKLAALFPNCVTESTIEKDGHAERGRSIDFDLLKQELSHAVVEGNKERYRLEWPGKREAIVTANLPTTKTLRPVREESVDFDNTENLYIEGDNLEVLKLLQESYLGKVKMIYIDPPYNTGKDFVYKDNFSKDAQEELIQSGQKDEYMQRLVANPETAGRYHSDWLSMMYPRLKLARNLLSQDGVIFISIDDNEIQNLRKLCDDIFGESQFVGTFPWRSRTAKADVPFGVSVDVEWIVAYAKDDFIAGRLGERKYHESDDFEDRWRLSDLTTNKTKNERPNSYFTMINPKNGDEYEASELRTWAVTTDTFDTYYKKEKIVFPGDYNFLKIKRPAYRVFESEDKQKAVAKYGSEQVKMAISSYLPEKQVGRTEHGSKEIRKLFGSQVFQYPKPTSLISFFIESISAQDAIVLDFFSGSSSTADAVLQTNAADKGKRKFIMVQLPEELNPKVNEQKTAYEFCKANKLQPILTEVAKERIRRAAKQIKVETGAEIDYGFRVYRLDRSNMQDVYYKPQDYDQNQLDLLADNVKANRSTDDLLAQVMLAWGLPLSLKIKQVEVLGKQVFKIVENSLYACFDKEIDEDFAKEIAKDKPLRMVFKDSGFKDDTAKTNVKQLLRQLSPETEMRVV
ncbi:site-specific DNA-methyltransferase [Candidatus Haliotispira prima]|uniref:site-specific DNA-methyltransferase (adenine-specific) n=1 Tax=Candidatus Haliotispira prima TaxID=3034016 RepID=A0ABY8MI80_9SPIO|nr:site-specific DNA-methyltransferase [Candidatus Haliotispira prima]